MKFKMNDKVTLNGGSPVLSVVGFEQQYAPVGYAHELQIVCGWMDGEKWMRKTFPDVMLEMHTEYVEPTEPPAFKKGDVVALIKSDLHMTATVIHEDRVETIWFEGRKLQKGNFPTNILELVKRST